MIQHGSLAGHIACFAAYSIFGLNIIICKDLTSGQFISPMALFCLRSLGAGLLFWILSAFTKKEKVETKDYPKIFAASVLGFFITQITFLIAIPQVTPMNCSIISAMSPIYTMFIAAAVLKEPVTIKKASGVALSLAGILLIIFNSVNMKGGAAESTPFGIFMMILNGLSFSFYLGIFKPLIGKYSVITFMKWIFLFSAVLSVPFATKEIVTLEWNAVPAAQLWELGYLIVFATFIAYFLIPVGQKRIRPTLVSMYSYVQPIIATLISIIIGMDILTWQKVLAAVMVFSGVVIVSRSKKKGDRDQ